MVNVPRIRLGRRWTTLLATVLAIVLVGASYTAYVHRPQKRLIEASWAETYLTVPELKKHSDVAVMGTVTSVLGHETSAGVQSTDFGVTVQRVLSDPHHLTSYGSVVRVHQTGGVSGNITEEISDDPLFVVGESTVLFLVQYDPHLFRVAGGPTGRFTVAGGQVRAKSRDGLPFDGSVDALAHLLSTS